MDQLIQQLLGPYGLSIGAILLAIYLGRLHIKADEKRDKALELLQESQPQLIETVNTQASIIETRLAQADKT